MEISKRMIKNGTIKFGEIIDGDIACIQIAQHMESGTVRFEPISPLCLFFSGIERSFVRDSIVSFLISSSSIEVRK